jgi:O-antigen/teichoic acid export membrane protein
VTRLSLGNYFAGLIAIAPTAIIPILITNILGAKFSAYFYMDMMIANVLYVIPTSTTTSLFAEGSYNEEELRLHLRKAIKIISIYLFENEPADNA